jgi:hypothetical protein
MATVEENRRINLRALAKEAGSSAALAEKSGYSEAQISQWINASKDSRTGRPRGMRPETCRHLEETMHRPAGWMDAEHADAKASVTSPALQLALAFDALPEVFEDGGTRVQFLARLLGLIQERRHLGAAARSDEPTPLPAHSPRKHVGKARTR